MRNEKIELLRELYNDIHSEIRELTHKRKQMPQTSYKHDLITGQIKGLTEAQMLLNRKVRILNNEEKEKDKCYI